MDGRVYSIGLLERTISFLLHKGSLFICASIFLLGFSSSIRPYKAQPVTGFKFEIGFSDFSPAFAAFEDEYLYNDNVPALPLAAGVSDQLFKKYTAVKAVSQPKVEAPKRMEDAIPDSAFDGEISFRRSAFVADKKGSVRMQQATVQNQALPSLKDGTPKINNEELRFGPLVASLQSASAALTSDQAPVTVIPENPPPKNKGSKPDFTKMTENALFDESADLPQKYRISGGIELKEGLAFIGTMEVSWVVGDYEYQSGSINTPDATFEIEVDELIGDVVLSLYDSKNDLIGEGFVDLSKINPTQSSSKQNVAIYPVNWDYAGKVIPVSSLGMVAEDASVRIKQKSIGDVVVELYAFNEATETKRNGEFSFPNWKKTNSRTLALASKKGYRDSVFLLDSNQPATVVLFDDDYMDAFFQTLSDAGVIGVKDQGTVYGEITGVSNRSGYQLKLGKGEPVYFTAGFARTDLDKTTQNGMFAFVGLEDGDYELNIEKDGEVIDQKIVVVEQGKVSPIVVDLKNISKSIEFYDPMNPNEIPSKVHLGFFDGMEKLELNEKGRVKTDMKSGNEPAIMDFTESKEINRVFVSRHKGLQKVPLLRDNRLFELAVKNEMSIQKGLIIGFVDSPVKYRVQMVEHSPEKTLYFNEAGIVVDPEIERPFGFIMSGFPQGLNSLSIERVQDAMILATDFVFSDHEAISIINTQIFDL